MLAAGPDALKVYGSYLGRRYATFDNVVWVLGGDLPPRPRASLWSARSRKGSDRSRAIRTCSRRISAPRPPRRTCKTKR